MRDGGGGGGHGGVAGRSGIEGRVGRAGCVDGLSHCDSADCESGYNLDAGRHCHVDLALRGDEAEEEEGDEAAGMHSAGVSE